MTLVLDHVQITHHQQALFQSVSLTVQPGTITTIMGPSGCGKSTLLSAITGSLSSDFEMTGDIILNNRRINDLPIEQRRVGILFQDDLLFPHMNVFANLAFALPARLNKAEKKQRINHALAAAELSDFEQRDIATLSGGQKARISLLRTLLAEPEVILLDEPFSKLDQTLRQSFREFVFQQIQQLNIPALMVTHDKADCYEQQAYLLDQGVLQPC